MAPVACAPVPNDSRPATFRPGWYADPIGRFDLRYHNGTEWTADVSADGTRYVDPLGLNVSTHSDNAPNGSATAAMVLGIIAVSSAWMPFLVAVGIVAAVVAIPLGIFGLRRSSASGEGHGRALAGVAMGVSALVAAVLGVLLTIIVWTVYEEYIDPAAHDVAITSCEVAGSRVTTTGEITNRSDDSAEFSVLIGFTRPDTDDPRASSRVLVDAVAPGATATFEAQRQVDLDEVDCIVLDVNGPLPFGLDLD